MGICEVYFTVCVVQCNGIVCNCFIADTWRGQIEQYERMQGLQEGHLYVRMVGQVCVIHNALKKDGTYMYM